jgi:N-sulfoglucosamine sulfohydrolase
MRTSIRGELSLENKRCPRLIRNALLFTADDMGADSVGLGCMGGEMPGITPNLDRFAARGMRFYNAHVNSAICVPSRGNIATGRHGFSSGVYGFKKAHDDVPTIMELLREHGYLTGILGKVDHSTPRMSYRWDYTRDYEQLGSGRSPTRYYESAAEFLQQAATAGKPFYFMVNSHDPHRPFQQPGSFLPGAEPPSKWYGPADVKVPGYLADLPGVRQELSHYFNSLRRLDDTFSRVMQALADAKMEEHTIVVFLSDNGIAMPFAKANCYLASSHTPLLIAWPGVTRANSSDREHFVSAIDLMPTFFEGLKLPLPAGVNGRSFLPLLHGGKQPGRESVFTQIDYKIGGKPTPMRAVQDGRYGYIFNPWSDQQEVYRNNNEGLTMKAMEAAAPGNPVIAERVRKFRYRDVEELYDLRRDPDEVNNLAGSREHRAVLDEYRKKLRTYMEGTRDPLLPTFDARRDPAAMKAEMEKCYGTVLIRATAGNATKGG